MAIQISNYIRFIAAVDLPKNVINHALAYLTEPHRAYHNIQHVINIFDRYMIDGAFNADAIFIARVALFHDVIYEPLRKDNEERSADIADFCLCGDPDRQEIVDTILMTKDHLGRLAQQATPRQHIFCDLDIIGFTDDWDTFYARNLCIRAEFVHLTDNQFYAGAAAFLQKFVDAERIYHVDADMALIEKAKTNLRRLIAIYKERDRADKLI